MKSKGNSHDWVQAQFAGVLIRQRKLYPSHIRSYLMDMLEQREKSDYSEILISKAIAKTQLGQATEFVTIITEKLQQ